MCRAVTSHSAARDIDKVLDADRPPPAKAITVTLSGQVETMRESYAGLFGGIGAGRRARLPLPGHQLSELDRSADRADGGAVRARRRACGCCS